MRTIYKYPLDVTNRQTLVLPIGSYILSLQDQNGIPTIWALVDSEQTETMSHEITMYGTGHPLSHDSGTWLATLQLGSFVWHFFYRMHM